MCGINGIIGPNKKIISKMNDLVKHRGPNDSGIFINSEIGLGHKRLSILDLSEKGHQPRESEKSIIVFNGEIYNFKEIKKLCEGKFDSDTDTEVIHKLYDKEGISFINKLNGMFSIGIYNKKDKKLFLIRDRLGIKPLYYLKTEKNLGFSSEIKSLLLIPDYKKKINMSGVSSYLSYRYVLGKETMFKGILKVLPGTYLEIDVETKKIIEKKYWDLDFKKSNLNYEEAVKKAKKIIENSIKNRMISDVPIGSYLSGGLDSSIISAVLSKYKKDLKTFTVGFDEENEFKYANIIAKTFNTDHKEIRISMNEYLKTMKELIHYKDEPLGVPNEIPLYLMSKELKKEITVVLSGEGADEIFMGYAKKFREAQDINRIKILQYLPGLKISKKYKKKFRTPFDHFLNTYTYFSIEEKNRIFKKNIINEFENDKYSRTILKNTYDSFKGKHIDKISYLFEKHHLPGLLQRVDTTTMATSVEARVPFVDHEVVQFALSLPDKFKIDYKTRISKIRSIFKTSEEITEKEDISKKILKDAFKDLIPEEIINRTKKGFPVPLERWFGDKFKEHSENILFSKNSKIKSLINESELKELIKKDGKKTGQKIWMLINLELWMQEYF